MSSYDPERSESKLRIASAQNLHLFWTPNLILVWLAKRDSHCPEAAKNVPFQICHVAVLKMNQFMSYNTLTEKPGAE